MHRKGRKRKLKGKRERKVKGKEKIPMPIRTLGQVPGALIHLMELEDWKL